ncbi:uncharacterized protein LOC130052320 [Ostrea edulis]|uniref:uncharacterized protein LOC130052320 n=1 Tax=Ostrea edulis TaxID=37623 RepID=UPI0024AEAFEC|nr:uncharacterized protein LOC130052320 [Ostrea edulis]
MKRRSSLAGSRIHLQFEKTEIKSCGELFKIISTDKTDEERLAALHRLSLEYTLQKLEEENPNLGGLQDMKKALLEQGLRTISELEENGGFKQACNNDRILAENPSNLELDEIIETLMNYNTRVGEEIEQWEKLLKDSSKAIADSEALKPDELPPVTWKEVMVDEAAAAAYLPGPLDAGLYNTLRRTVLEVNNTVEKLSKTVSTVQKIQTICDNIVKEKCEKFQADYFEDNVMFTPRTIIQKIIDHKTPKV